MNNVLLVSIMPEDEAVSGQVLAGLVAASRAGTIDFMGKGRSYLAYLMPVDYIMQGMIANTGGEYHLFKKHHTFFLIMDWVWHPFEHLKRSPAMHMAGMHHGGAEMARRQHCPLGIHKPELKCSDCPYRRVILVEVQANSGRSLRGKQLFAFDTSRLPVGFVDINTATGKIIAVNKVAAATAWKDVPTPAI